MRTKDHLILGRFLLHTTRETGLHKHRRAFLLGCVEPDYNKVTYLRGMKSHKKFRGHNAENAFPCIQMRMNSFQINGIHSAWDYFLLGTLLHYAADSFTSPHNNFWEKNFVQHTAYEHILHRAFPSALIEARLEHVHRTERPLRWFTDAHMAYCAAPHTVQMDCRFIIRVCRTVLDACLRYADSLAVETADTKGGYICASV